MEATTEKSLLLVPLNKHYISTLEKKMMAVGEFISYVGKEYPINVIIFRYINLIIIYIMIKRSFHYQKYIKRLFYCESCKPKCQERMIMHNFMCKYCLSIVEKLWISIFLPKCNISSLLSYFSFFLRFFPYKHTITDYYATDCYYIVT